MIDPNRTCRYCGYCAEKDRTINVSGYCYFDPPKRGIEYHKAPEIWLGGTCKEWIPGFETICEEFPAVKDAWEHYQMTRTFATEGKEID